MLRLILLCLLTHASPAIAQRAPEASAPTNPAGYPAIPLLSTGTTIMGEKLRYPIGDPHVTAAIVTLAPGQRTIAHKHAVPLFAYILEGEFSVDYGARGVRIYKPGESFMEAMDVAHFGFNAGTQPAKLIAVYMGANGTPDVEPMK